MIRFEQSHRLVLSSVDDERKATEQSKCFRVQQLAIIARIQPGPPHDKHHQSSILQRQFPQDLLMRQ